MKPKTIYLALCFVGASLPYGQFVPWLFGHGLDRPLFVRERFGNRISAFLGMDVLVSALVLVVFMRVGSARLNLRRRWLPVLAVLRVGVSLGLPTFLYLRELSMEQVEASGNTAVPA